MSTAETVPIDRRQRRRLETIEEVLDIAAEIMTEQGVAGLSIGEIARRMGIRPPSLYVYFPSKNALYDALFARGAERILAVAEQQHLDSPADGRELEQQLLTSARAFVGWCVANPAYTQLLFWRPVPGFTPSAEAYAPAVRMIESTQQWFAGLQERGLLRADAHVDAVLRDFTVLTSGVISQQLSNAPDEAPESGRFVAALPDLVAMFARHYAAATPSSTTSRGRARHADRR
ncbi:MAG: TetR/AcrR family transcriptional regulator [Actinobacteria bacterium]|nr:TetR/AcrR family transcriptional regulator [Actinomycetota bacterium]